jgi:ssDNA-binding Zn-finger/Zn-ribbon topoisomerase 1
MITFIKNILNNFRTTNNPKIIPKFVPRKIHKNLENQDDTPEEIFNDRFALIKRRSQIGNLISYRTRATSMIVYPETEQQPEEVKEEPLDVNNLQKKYIIKVRVDVIEENKNQEIVKIYNEAKPPNWPPLQILDRAEGGFQIEIPEKKDIKCANQNDKIKQLRWRNKALVGYSRYPTFNQVELQLLLRAMRSVLGDNVYTE